jgi:hypothetical protein
MPPNILSEFNSKFFFGNECKGALTHQILAGVVPCVFIEEENDYRISLLKVESRLVYRSMFSYFSHKSKVLRQPSVTTWDEEYLLKYSIGIVYFDLYSLYLILFRNL